MLSFFMPLLGTETVLAEAAITWTPKTFYVTMGIIHAVAILVGFRLMGVDPEHNTFIGALLAAAIINVAAFFTKDAGLIGVMIAGALLFGLLVAISSGEVIKAFFMSILLIAAYAGVGSFLVPRTPLTIDEIAGIPRVVMLGGLEAEPITEDTTDDLLDRKEKKK